MDFELFKKTFFPERDQRGRAIGDEEIEQR
jgi:hypothetical protein